MRLKQREGPALQRLARALLRRPMRVLWPVAISGSEHVPAVGPAILCPNHLSFFDSVLMMLAFDRPVYLIGKDEYLGSWKTRRLFPAMGMIPIDRDSGTRAMIALDAAAAVLRDGALLCIYPEGTRSRDGRLHRGHTGAARLARAVGCPLVPVGICGTAELQPPGARLPRIRRKCSIAVGAPLTARSTDARGRAARAVTDELMTHISRLGGQEYVGSYSTRPETDATVTRGGRQLAPGIVAATA